jgi:hypothetical protein
MPRARAVPVVGAVLAALLTNGVLAGCSSGNDTGAAPETTAPATTAPSSSGAATPSTSAGTPAATPSATPTASPLTDLADGRNYGLLTTFDPSGHTLVVDIVQFLTGAAAEKAAKEDGQEADNDYYVRNQNKRLRTLRFGADVTIVVNTLTAERTGDATKDTRITKPELKSYFDKGEAQQRLFYLTLTGGVVTEIHEQYLP